MPDTHDPRAITLAAHRNYCLSGSNDNRLLWTVHTFLSNRALGDDLGVGCGDVALLQLLAERGINVPMKSRLIACSLRRLIEHAYRIFGVFPAFCYWLWTFDCHKQEGLPSDICTATASWTRPGTGRDFSSTTGNSSAITR